MWRRLIALILMVVFCLPVAACEQQSSETAVDDGRLNIVTTIFPPYDFTRQIAGNAVNLHMLLRPGTESHSYDPTPQDIKTIQAADLFIYVGGENDAWVEDILASMGDQAPDTLKMVDCVELLDEEIVEGMQHREVQETEHVHEADEHVWTAPLNAALIADAICEKLCAKDTANAEKYQAANAAYRAELEELDADFRTVVANGSRNLLIFGDRFPFLYFATAYGLEYYAAFPGCAADTEPSAATVAFLIDKARQEQIPVVFEIEFSNGRIADAICEASGAVKLEFHSCHNVTPAEFEAGVSYIDLMRRNLANLQLALQ